MRDNVVTVSGDVSFVVCHKMLWEKGYYNWWKGYKSLWGHFPNDPPVRRITVPDEDYHNFLLFVGENQINLDSEAYQLRVRRVKHFLGYYWRIGGFCFIHEKCC